MTVHDPKDGMRTSLTQCVINSPWASSISHRKSLRLIIPHPKDTLVHTLGAVLWLQLEVWQGDWTGVCLFGRAQSCKLFAQQASSALWENSHMVVCLPGWLGSSLRNGLTQTACCTCPASCTCQCNKSQQLLQCMRKSNEADKVILQALAQLPFVVLWWSLCGGMQGMAMETAKFAHRYNTCTLTAQHTHLENNKSTCQNTS